jgi:RNA polymerase sigma factor (sigma-70 family)
VLIMLTPAQKQLTSDNHDLINWFLHKHLLDREEFYGICAIGFCKAAENYDESKGNFSTYAHECMQNEVRQEMVSEKRKKHIPDFIVGSLETPISENLTLWDILTCEDDFSEFELSEIINKLKPRFRDDLILILEGFTGRDICRMHGLSNNAFYQEKLRIRKALQKETASAL